MGVVESFQDSPIGLFFPTTQGERLMNGRLTSSLALAAAALLTALPGRVQAQERYRVLVPDFFALNGADKGFGGQVAEELRKQMEALVTHQPIEKKEINDQLRQFKMKM